MAARSPADRRGPVVLVGGDEFRAGNEDHDRLVVASLLDGPLCVITTAAARGGPERAAATAAAWFATLGATAEPLHLLTAGQARDPAMVRRARDAGGFYLCGGDPGLVPKVLLGSPAWHAVMERWSAGAPLAGSSAGAMALCEWTLVRAGWPDRTRRKAVAGLGVVPGCAVLPHYDTFGAAWRDSARDATPAGTALIGPAERAAAVWRSAFGWKATGAGGCVVVRETVEPHAAGTALDLPSPRPALVPGGG